MLLTFQVLNLIPLFHCLCSTKVSVEVQGTCICFITKPVFTVRNCQHIHQPQSWRTIPCRLSATAYSTYLQLPSILEAVPPSAPWGCSMQWWQGSTDYGNAVYYCCFLAHKILFSADIVILALGARKTSYTTVWYNLKYWQLFWVHRLVETHAASNIACK